MAGPSNVLSKSFLAGGAIGIYRAVEIAAGEVVTQANAGTDAILGICQEEITADDVTRGRVANVQMLGVSRCIAGAAITIGATVMTDGTGRVIAATATNRPIGMALQAAAAAGDHVDVFLTPTGSVI
jgi:hypothetical protein